MIRFFIAGKPDDTSAFTSSLTEVLMTFIIQPIFVLAVFKFEYFKLNPFVKQLTKTIYACQGRFPSPKISSVLFV